MYTVKDDPLARAVSLIGKVNADRIHKFHSSFKKSSKRSFEDIRRSSTRLKIPSSPVSTSGSGMDILRGVYTFTQVKSIEINLDVIRTLISLLQLLNNYLINVRGTCRNCIILRK